jgi:hypothetical protein
VKTSKHAFSPSFYNNRFSAFAEPCGSRVSLNHIY